MHFTQIWASSQTFSTGTARLLVWFILQCLFPVHFNTDQPCAVTSDRKRSVSHYALWFRHRQITDTLSLSLFYTHRHRGMGTKGSQEQRPGQDKTLKNIEENSETEWAVFKGMMKEKERMIQRMMESTASHSTCVPHSSTIWSQYSYILFWNHSSSLYPIFLKQILCTKTGH